MGMEYPSLYIWYAFEIWVSQKENSFLYDTHLPNAYPIYDTQLKKYIIYKKELKISWYPTQECIKWIPISQMRIPMDKIRNFNWKWYFY